MSCASSLKDMRTTSPISPVEEYINSYSDTCKVCNKIIVPSKDVATQTYSYDNALPFTMIEPFEIDDDYVAKKLMLMSKKK